MKAGNYLDWRKRTAGRWVISHLQFWRSLQLPFKIWNYFIFQWIIICLWCSFSPKEYETCVKFLQSNVKYQWKMLVWQQPSCPRLPSPCILLHEMSETFFHGNFNRRYSYNYIINILHCTFLKEKKIKEKTSEGIFPICTENTFVFDESSFFFIASF